MPDSMRTLQIQTRSRRWVATDSLRPASDTMPGPPAANEV